MIRSALMQATSSNQISSSAAKPALDGVKLLLVEDSPDNCEIFSFFLERAGAEVEIANDGLAGVSAATHDPDLILMDIQLPLIDGKEATRRIRANGYNKPIVALTAHAFPEEVANCLSAGCDGMITKPVKGDTFIQEVANYLGEKWKN